MSLPPTVEFSLCQSLSLGQQSSPGMQVHRSCSSGGEPRSEATTVLVDSARQRIPTRQAVVIILRGRDIDVGVCSTIWLEVVTKD